MTSSARIFIERSAPARRRGARPARRGDRAPDGALAAEVAAGARALRIERLAC